MSTSKEKLIALKHKSKLLTYLWYIYKQPQFIRAERALQKQARERAAGAEDARYLGLQRYKGLHKGKRCFIVATGPSLRLSDLDLLKDEYTFGMNSVTKLYNDTPWRPTYYGIQDSNVYEKMQESITQWYAESDNVFVSSHIAEIFGVPENYQQFPYDFVYHNNQAELDKYFARFSDDAYSLVYDGYSITYSLIQIAVYMGFTEIYLLGADCSYKRGAKNHIVDSGNDDKNEEKNHDKMIVGYQKAKEYADSHGIKIVNCTRGGMLEVYERKSLESVLGLEQDN